MTPEHKTLFFGDTLYIDLTTNSGVTSKVQMFFKFSMSDFSTDRCHGLIAPVCNCSSVVSCYDIRDIRAGIGSCCRGNFSHHYIIYLAP